MFGNVLLCLKIGKIQKNISNSRWPLTFQNRNHASCIMEESRSGCNAQQYSK